MVLLHGGNPKEKIYEELVLFMNSPEVAEHFVLWLFGEVERLGRVSAAPVAPRASEMSQQNGLVAGQAYNNPTDGQALPSTIEVVDVQMTGGSSSTGARLQGTRNFSKALEGAINPGNNRKSHSMNTDHQHQHNNNSYQPSSRVTRSSSTRNRSVSPQRTGSRRVVRSSPQDDSGKVQKIRVSVDFDRDERRRTVASGAHKSSFKKQLQIREEGGDDGTNSQESESATSNKIKVKCQYWPNCRSGDACPNVHPSETCKHFPNCQFGDACTFVHPSIPCKFQEKCQNPLCNYQHRPTAFMNPMIPNASMSSSASGSSTILCKFYPRCVNVNCPYLHPVKAQCRYGIECSRPDCPFEHASGRKGAHLKSVVFAPCKYGKQCARADCPYQHNLEDSTGVADASIATPTMPATTTTIDTTDMQS